jgi:hypothetical protein
MAGVAALDSEFLEIFTRLDVACREQLIERCNNEVIVAF